MIIKTTIHKWNEIDFEDIAAVMYATEQAKVQKRKDIQSLLREFLHWEYKDLPVVICAWSHETLIGWLMLHFTNPVMVEINPGPFGGHPFVLPESELKVKSILIKEAINYATMRGFEKIDVTFSEEESNKFKAYETLYRGYGFHPFYFCMKCDLSDHRYEDVTLPAGIEMKRIREVSDNDLYDCYYDAFNAGEAQFFFEQTDKERWQFFKELSSEGTLCEESSLVLIEDQQVIGFTYVVEYGGENNSHLNLICIHPDYQGKGLGRTLLLLSMKKAVQEYLTMTLYTEADTSALKLYEECGFKKGGGSITYIYKIA